MVDHPDQRRPRGKRRFCRNYVDCTGQPQDYGMTCTLNDFLRQIVIYLKATRISCACRMFQERSVAFMRVLLRAL
jgi:hypothetical protein